jgi:hypothetical protein
VMVAVLFEPGFAGLALPVVALWWLRIGQRSSLRSARTTAARAQLVGLFVAPGLALGALAIALLRGPSAHALLWPGWERGGAPIPFFLASASGVAKVLAQMLGPTAIVAAAAGGLALLLPARRAAAAPGAPTSALAAMSSGAQPAPIASAATSSSLCGGVASAASPGAASIASAAQEAPPGPWTFAMLLAMAASGAFFDMQRLSIGVPSAAAIALAAGVAIHRLSAMATISLASPPATVAALEPPATLTAGAMIVAFTAGFLVLGPSLAGLL